MELKENKDKIVKARIDFETYNLLELYCKINDITISQYVRNSIKYMLKNNGMI